MRLPPSWTLDDLKALIETQVPVRVRRAGRDILDAEGVQRFRAFGSDILEGSVDDDGFEVEVQLGFRHTELRFACSCVEASREMCAHVWAAVAAVVEREQVPCLSARGGRELVRATPLSWRGELERLEDAGRRGPDLAPAWNARDRLFYVLDSVSNARFVTQSAGGADVLEIRFGTRRQSKDGLGPFKRREIHTHARPAGLADADWEALLLLGGIGGGHREGRSFPAEVRCPASLAPFVLAGLARTGALVAGDTEDRSVPEVLTWDDAGVWTVALDSAVDARTGHAVLTPALVRGREKHSLAAGVHLFAPGLARVGNALVRVDSARAEPWIEHVEAHGPLAVPVPELPLALEQLSRMRSAPPLAATAALGLPERGGTPVPVLLLDAPGETEVLGRLELAYGPARIPYHAPGPRTLVPQTREMVLRDTDDEERRVAELRALGVEVAPPEPRRPYELDPPEPEALRLPLARFSTIVQALIATGWLVEAEGRRVHGGGAVHVRVASHLDWFDIVGNVKYDGELAPLPAVLLALRRGSRLVRLDDGSVGVLPERWLERFRLLEELGRREGDALRFSRAQAGFLDGLLDDDVELDADAVFTEARGALRSFARVEPEDAPAGFVGDLRPYQREGLGWLAFLDRFGFGGCLADDMGLGKTVQVLAWLARVHAPKKGKKAQAARAPSLIVMPRSLLFNWKDEAARFTPHLDVLVHHGPDRWRDGVDLRRHDLILTTYGTVRRDAEALAKLSFDYLVIDEAQAVKNAETVAARALRGLSCRRRLALTGTPVENHLSELASMMDFLNPGFFGRRPIVSTDAARFDPGLAAAVRRALRPFLLRRTKDAVARQLPARSEQTLLCRLEPEQRALYDALSARFRSELLVPQVGTDKQLLVLEALLRLRQVACHPALVDPNLRGAASAKLDVLIPRVNEVIAEGHKVLVFSQFTALLALVRERLDAHGIVYEYLDGQVQDRAARVARFQTDPDCPVFLISLRAGGVGLNLTAADYVYILDPWWNPSVEAQAIDRAHRIGQTRPVVAYRLVAQDTVEQRILELQARKRELADAILSEEGAALSSLTRADLERLLA